MPSEMPSVFPTYKPTNQPSFHPTENPTDSPTETPSESPTETPTETPSEQPVFAAKKLKVRYLSEAKSTKVTKFSSDNSLDTFVKVIGDMNGDGIHDIVVGSPQVSPFEKVNAGVSYVIYGGNHLENIDFAALTSSQGFKISGSAAGDYLGYDSDDAGDVNGDGLTDLIIGAHAVNPSGKATAGIAYIIYGKKEGSSHIDLSSLTNSQGFRVLGGAEGDHCGWAVSSAGDVNGDGIGDVVIGAFQANKAAGISYVIYGKRGGSDDIDLTSTLPAIQGFRILGATIGDHLGVSVSAGDINGDGMSDVILGANFANPGDKKNAGITYVIYGKPDADSADVNLASLTSSQGFRILGAAANDGSGKAISSTKDVNEDGLSDVIIGAPHADSDSKFAAGVTYIIYGKRGELKDIDLATLSFSQGFRVFGAAAGDQSGSSVSSAGDVNGDGIVDIIISTYPDDKTSASMSYILFGELDVSADIDLALLTSSQGFKVPGATVNENSGASINAEKDVTGDGLLDIVVGSKDEMYVICGQAAGFSSDIASVI